MVGSSHYNFTRHFRPLFPRAPFAPLDAEVILEQRLFAYGIGQRFLLKDPVDTVGSNWIHQARICAILFWKKAETRTIMAKRACLLVCVGARAPNHPPWALKDVPYSFFLGFSR